MQFDFSNINIVAVAIGLVLGIQGLVKLITGNPLASAGIKAKYTEESLKKAARPTGLLEMLVGIGCALWPIVHITSVERGTEFLIKTIFIFGLLIIDIVVTFSMRKKKQQ